jgi:hypothetical protein
LRDLWGTYVPAIAIFAFVALLGLILAWWFFPRRSRTLPVS